jgi:hypothetical protein
MKTITILTIASIGMLTDNMYIAVTALIVVFVLTLKSK